MFRLCLQDGPIRFFRFRDLPALMVTLGHGDIGRYRAMPLGVEVFQQLRRIRMIWFDIKNQAASLRGGVEIAFQIENQLPITPWAASPGRAVRSAQAPKMSSNACFRATSTSCIVTGRPRSTRLVTP